MKILFLSENFPPESNAAATRVYERACYWAEWGHQVTVITSVPNFPEGKLFAGFENKWKQVETMSGIRVVRVKTYIAANRGVAHRTLDFLSFMATGFLAALKEQRPDVIAATSPQFFTAVAGWAASATRGVPFVFELGDLWPASISAVGAMKKSFALGLVEKLELFLYRRSAAIAALTGSFKDNLVSRGIDADKISVVINGVDLSRYAPRPQDTALADEWGFKGKFVAGYIGTHGMAHALGNVLDAAERLKDNDTIRFLLAGAGAERDALMADATSRGLNNVVFMPRQPKETMPAVWSLCDVALVHLKNSPVFAGVIPSKIFEAEAMGLPLLLAAPEGEASSIVLSEKAGLHVEPEDPDALAAAVRQLANDGTLCQTLAAAALAAAPSHSRKTQAREMLDVLQTAASGVARGALS
ncbi:MAG: glycosyltransferase family 4 protein [Rhodospirillaceae bacterium]|jgi:colanic acid biosynthesis glycosyl transferase WcaI|nr:glycosyltransferase family 4 protein [Rhodospirillaceae bacterium]MBT5242937.1 glycosyltransferase family 4 protein [Rhodospirillaceae bacterium]MBT5563161.1 glycosyltransferase family 4 protein [Rhodospirillaceae bacterium]MBT6243476.1 glycosyltransferase family 4 protein [Rhodospirillaceae bacterium]